MIKTVSFTPSFPHITLTAYLHDDNHVPRTAMLICPGGAYVHLSDRESEPIARYYLSAGMNAFVLSYSVGEGAANYAPLIQAASAIRHLREHAEEYRIDPQKILIIGFSAGGHLAASAGILWNSKVLRDALGVTDGSSPEGIGRPNGMILCYPVITGLAHRHARSFKQLCGKTDPSEEERRPFSLELHVDETTPPAFIWHTCADEGVPVQNSLLLMQAMGEKKVPFEAHIFPDGPHGIALGTVETACGNPQYLCPHVSNWSRLSVEWANELFKNK